MKIAFLGLIIIVLTCSAAVDKDGFYEVLSGDSKELVENLINEYEQVADENSLVTVFKGALYIKRAAFLTVPARKLESFTKGRDLLEQEILKNPNNTEYRLIRLILQEQTPPFLKYKVNLEEDKKFIMASYLTANAQLKNRILNYSRKSKVLNVDDFGE
jgi:hypothetical protein